MQMPNPHKIQFRDPGGYGCGFRGSPSVGLSGFGFKATGLRLIGFWRSGIGQ